MERLPNVLGSIWKNMTFWQDLQESSIHSSCASKISFTSLLEMVEVSTRKVSSRWTWWDPTDEVLEVVSGVFTRFCDFLKMNSMETNLVHG